MSNQLQWHRVRQKEGEVGFRLQKFLAKHAKPQVEQLSSLVPFSSLLHVAAGFTFARASSPPPTPRRRFGTRGASPAIPSSTRVAESMA